MRLLLGFLTQSRCAAETQALMAEEKKEFKAEDQGGWRSQTARLRTW